MWLKLNCINSNYESADKDRTEKLLLFALLPDISRVVSFPISLAIIHTEELNKYNNLKKKFANFSYTISKNWESIPISGLILILFDVFEELLFCLHMKSFSLQLLVFLNHSLKEYT